MGACIVRKLFNDVIRHKGQGWRTNCNRKVENSLCKLPLNWVCQDSNSNGFKLIAINHGLNTKGVSICKFWLGMPSNVIIYVSTCLEILWLMYVILTLISLLVVLSYSTITNQNCPLGTLLISNPRISNLNLNPITITLTLNM
jgi:hypothetical protein